MRNRARCLRCSHVIESRHRHDFQSCECGAIFVDGGLDYWRRGGDAFDPDFDSEEDTVGALAVAKPKRPSGTAK